MNTSYYIASPAVHRLCCQRILWNFSKNLHTITKSRIESNIAVNEAEKIIGYPTSFLSLRWLLNDEIANVSMQLGKLIGLNHPLLKTARELILHKQVPSYGLIVLLLSKAGGLGRQFSQMDCDITAGILYNQRLFAEITEMIRMASLLHKSILPTLKDDEFSGDLHFGNRLTILIGDYILGNSFKEMADLKSHEINELISTCLRDLIDANFIEPRDSQDQPLPAKPLGKQTVEIEIPNHFDVDVLNVSEFLGNAKAEWTVRHLLDAGSLLAKACQGTLMLAEHPHFIQKRGYLFGRNIALALQARNDLLIFRNDKSDPFSLISAPLMFHLEYDVSYYTELMEDVGNHTVDYKKIKDIVRTGPGITKTVELLNQLSTNTLRVLDEFSDSEAKTALANIIKTM